MEIPELMDNRVHTLCRTCLEFLFEGNEYDIFLTPNLAKWLSICTSLMIEENDGFPKLICNTCYKKVQDFYEFREMCMQSMKKFDDIKLNLYENVETKLKISNEELFVNANLTPTEKENEFLPDNENTEISSKEDDPLLFTEDNNDLNCNTNNENKEEEENRSDEVDKTTKRTKKPKRQVLSCNICTKKFLKQEKYDAHMRVHSGLKPWECSECKKQFGRYDTLKDHIKYVHGSQDDLKQFTCTYENCNKSYKYRENLKAHIRHAHTGERKVEAKVFVCEECGKSMSNAASLKRHQMVHSGTYPHKCTLCPKRYIEKNKLEEHMRRHNGIKNYVCSICGLKTVTQRDLNVHTNHHTKEKVTKCGLCEYTSTSRASVKRHENVVHHGIKAYVCKYCGNCFGKSETLKLHERTHTGEKPYECHICGRRFTQRTPLKMHIRRHEKDLTTATITTELRN